MSRTVWKVKSSIKTIAGTEEIAIATNTSFTEPCLIKHLPDIMFIAKNLDKQKIRYRIISFRYRGNPQEFIELFCCRDDNKNTYVLSATRPKIKESIRRCGI